MTTLPAPSPTPATHTPAATPRGTVVVLPGRGEHPGVYQRLGRRLAADGYLVVVTGDVGERSVRTALATGGDGARVLLGTDAGAVHAWAHAAAHPRAVDALVLAGLPLDGGTPAGADNRAAELDLRTSCPVHRALLDDDPRFGWGRLDDPVPARPVALPEVPTLLVHGTADRVSPLEPVAELGRAAPQATLAVVEGAVHDVLNDRFHRSVAARLVLFVEEVAKGAVLRDDRADPASERTRRRRSGPLQVSARLDYALRAVTALPADPDAEPVRCEAVARSQGIPLNSLVNLMVDLRRAGLVRSRRGCEGGYWLARPARQITVADVVRAVEGEVAAVPTGPGTAVWGDLAAVVTTRLSRRTLDEEVTP